MQNNNILDNHYLITRTITSGLFSDVSSCLVTNIHNNNQYVAKVRINDPNNPNHYFQNEVQMTVIASGLNNPYIIHLNGHGLGILNYQGVVTNNTNYMILEYCHRGDLWTYINLGGFLERHAKYIFKKILLGVQALHEAGYCHRDLKLDNILLDHNFNPKINNFSFSRQFRQNNQPILLNDMVGTPVYSSPQILANQPYNGEKADIFSLGIILFNLVSGKKPFYSADKYDRFYGLIVKGKNDRFWKEIVRMLGIIDFSNEFKDLFISMVAFNENGRPNIPQILHHHWFDEINDLDNEELNQLEIEVRNEFLLRTNQLMNNNNNNNGNGNNP